MKYESDGRTVLGTVLLLVILIPLVLLAGALLLVLVRMAMAVLW